MIRRGGLTLAVALLATGLLATGLMAGDSLDKILDKSYEARGGLKNLKAVETARIEGTFVIPGMMEAPIVIEWKRPDKIRMEFETPQGRGVQAFDGDVAWAHMPGAPAAMELPGDQASGLRRQADLIDGPLVDWKSKGNSVEYVGEDELDGVAMQKIKVTLADGTEQLVFLDAGSFLPVHQSGTTMMQGAETDVETYIGEYKKIDKVMMAHAIKTELIDMGMTQELTLESFEFNLDLGDDRFAMPAAEPAAAPASD